MLRSQMLQTMSVIMQLIASHRLRLLLKQTFLDPSEVHIHSFRNQI